MLTTKEEKEAVRQEVLARFRYKSKLELAKKSRKLRERLYDFVNVIGAKSIMTFDPKKNDPDIDLFNQNMSLRNDIKCYYPKFYAETSIVPKMVNKADDLVLNASVGCFEPKELSPTAFIKDIDLIFIPGMAFDKKNLHVVGNGKGVYDKFLAGRDESSYLVIGLCFDFQLFPSLPSLAHDKKVDAILTEKNIYEPERQKVKA